MGRPMESPVVLIAYNGFDSAAAAAALLGKYPGAQVMISSAARIAGTLGKVQGEGAVVHILGVGARCERGELEREVGRIAGIGGRIVWYCKGDYLEEVRGCLEGKAELVVDVKCTLPEIVCRAEGISGRHAEKLIGATRKSFDRDEALKDDWVALVNASIARFFRFQDNEAVLRAIRKLGEPAALDGADFASIRNYRRWGNRFLAGKSELMGEFRKRVKKIAEDGECTVLITGETGTGKDLVAQMIHEYSPRSIGPFHVVSCASFDDDLVADALFGHEKGAFTGAIARTDGIFMSASGGTLFLDEISEIPLALQAKLLRVIDDRTVTRLGSNDDIAVNVRILCATNRDLAGEVRRGRFREDLYYRLNKISVRAPSLREHIEDIPVIAQEVLNRFSYARGIDVPKLSKSQIECMMKHDWPGNVRELENVLTKYLVEKEQDFEKLIEWCMERTAAGAAGVLGMLGAGMKTGEAGKGEGKGEMKIEKLKDYESRYIRDVYEHLGRNKSKAARALGISTNTLKGKLQKIYRKKEG